MLTPDFGALLMVLLYRNNGTGARRSIQGPLISDSSQRIIPTIHAVVLRQKEYDHKTL